MHPSLTALHSAFRSHADPEAAAAMKDYMRGQFAYFGIKSAQRRSLSKTFIQEAGRDQKRVSESLIREMWEQPEREFQLCALDALIKYQRHAPVAYLELYKWLIVNKSWWDTVDLIASHLIGGMLTRFPEQKQSVIQSYVASDNLWLQRTSIIFQLKYREKTDWELLKSNCLQFANSEEFFLQKAIGWALRQYSKFEPETVRQFIHTHDLASLSRREASKYL